LAKIISKVDEARLVKPIYVSCMVPTSHIVVSMGSWSKRYGQNPITSSFTSQRTNHIFNWDGICFLVFSLECIQRQFQFMAQWVATR
jgi:hypothetical protein